MPKTQKAAALVAVDAPETESEEALPKGVQIKTLGELGATLPIGIPSPSGALSKAFSIKTWKTKDEREIGKLKKPTMNMAQYVGTVLAHMLTTLGPHEFGGEEKMVNRRLLLQQAFLGDIWYVYVYLRTEAIGQELNLSLNCPSCAKKFKFAADLTTLPVRCVQSLEDTMWLYELRDPFQIRGKLTKQLRLSNPRWGSMEAHGSDMTDETAGKLLMTRASIVGLNDDPTVIQLSDFEIDDLSKRDLEGVARRINSEFLGPKMAVDGVCPNSQCEQEFLAPLNWTYDSFFSISSQ